MNTKYLIFSTACVLCALAVGGESFTATQTMTYELGTNQVAEITAPKEDSVYFSRPGNSLHIHVPIDWASNPISGCNTGPGCWQPFKSIVAGPATLQLYAGTSAQGDFIAPPASTLLNPITVHVYPQAFPVEKTEVVPNLSNGATVSLQVSSNLVDWVTTTNGVFSGTNGPQFFRINLQRAP